MAAKCNKQKRFECWVTHFCRVSCTSTCKMAARNHTKGKIKYYTGNLKLARLK